MQTIIGIVGVKTSGKSTVAEMIQKHLPDGQVVELALADKLKNICAKTFDLPREAFDDQRYKEVPFSIFRMKKFLQEQNVFEILYEFGYDYNSYKAGIKSRGLLNMQMESPRHIAQIVGTQLLREIGDADIHCRNVSVGPAFTIISDIRFENEHRYFKDAGYNFIPFYVHRKQAEDQVDLENGHASETSVFKFRDNCIKIENNGTLGDLENSVKVAVHKYVLKVEPQETELETPPEEITPEDTNL